MSSWIGVRGELANKASWLPIGTQRKSLVVTEMERLVGKQKKWKLASIYSYKKQIVLLVKCFHKEMHIQTATL